MQRLPSLRMNRPHSTFMNPLSGSVFNNTRYEQGIQSFRQNSVRDSLSLQQTNRRQSVKYKSHHQIFTKSPRFVFARPPTLPLALNFKTQQKISEYQFPLIQILVLDSLNSLKNIKKNTFSISFKQYFNTYFKLKGIITQQFINVVSPIIKNIFQNNPQYIEKDTVLNFTTKNQFLKAFKQMTVQMQQIAVLNYCTPNSALQQSCLRDIILECTKRAYQQIQLGKELTFQLLDSNGKLITNILQIDFDTTILYMSSVQNGSKLFQRYKSMNQQQKLISKKTNFSETLKLNFRKNIGYDKCDQQLTNLNDKFINLPRKNLHRIRPPKQKMFKPNCSIKNKSSNKIAFQTKANKQIKIQNILTQQLQQQFIKLVQDYHYVDFRWKQKYPQTIPHTFLHENKYFSHMNTNQFAKIIQSMNNIWKTKKVKQIQFATNPLNQNKLKINLQTNINNPTIDKLIILINKERYLSLRKVMLCIGEQIEQFLDLFLQYDEFNELRKEDIRKMLQIVIQMNKRSVDVIQQILWAWLRFNKVVENDGVLLKRKMHESYKKNTVLYYLLISIIFGTNEKSPQQLLHQIIQI